ncbi:MAG TPA: Lrp/AsnC ligand binding domain-containing protein [Steroidobacteraceae bacterium]|jgi:Lrp/AsnC family leucine-responsive transcriptional regulator
MADSSPRNVSDLDRVDRQILDELQSDGRLAVAELARRVHLSTTPCLERMRRLERDGFIKDYIARLDIRRLGFDLLAFIEVSLDRTNPDFFERFRLAVGEIDEVIECHMVAGNFDYLLKVRAVSMVAFRRFLVEKLTSIAGLQNTHTYFTLEEIKADARLPLTPVASARSRKRRS